MPVINENYDQLKIDKLRHYLEAQAEKGQAKPFEIFVDSLKVVSKTDNPKEFDSYEYYMNEDTEKVRILIYNSHLTPRNDQYSFLVQRHKAAGSLNGLGEIENIVQEKLAARDREHEMTRLREELEAAKTDLQEAEDYAEKLEKEIEYIKENKFKFGNIKIGELASVAMEGMIRRNPQLLTKLPGGETLAGIIVQDNEEQNARLLKPREEPTGEVSFQKKSSSEQRAFSEIELHQLQFLQQLQSTWDAKQVGIFNAVLEQLSGDPSKLDDIAIIFDINH